MNLSGPITMANGAEHGKEAAAHESRHVSHTPEKPTNPPTPPPFNGRFLVIPILVLLAIVGFVLWNHHRSHTELEADTLAMAEPTVLVVHPKLQPTQMSIVLPGRVQALMESAIYARVSGYLKRWVVDIGTVVKEGQLLAEIDTPETDQQLNQARAVRQQTQADAQLAQLTADRWKRLLKDNAVSQQEADEKISTYEVKKADLAASEANLKRLEELQSFQKVYAPFDGVITARKTDVGNLINAGGAGQELFRIAQTRTLRVYVNVPEVYSSQVNPGIEASVEMATLPGQPVKGKLVRTAAAIDPSSHTLLAEIEVPNDDNKLLPGGYAQVSLAVSLPNPPLLIPANALIFRAKGAQVAVVKEGTNEVHLANITIGRDFGNNLEIIQGLDEKDQVIMNPSDSLAEKTRVRVEAAKDAVK